MLSWAAVKTTQKSQACQSQKSRREKSKHAMKIWENANLERRQLWREWFDRGIHVSSRRITRWMRRTSATEIATQARTHRIRKANESEPPISQVVLANDALVRRARGRRGRDCATRRGWPLAERAWGLWRAIRWCTPGGPKRR